MLKASGGIIRFESPLWKTALVGGEGHAPSDLTTAGSGSVGRNPPAKQETRVQSLGQKDPPEKDIATHCSILAWRIPWTEEPGGHGVARSQTGLSS